MAALSAWAALGPAQLAVLAEQPDRWGRVAVMPVRDGASALAHLVAAGHVAVTPDGLPTRCIRALLALEAAPRAAGRGVWAVWPTPAVDAERVRAALGRYAVVEGRIRRISTGTAALYLNFDGIAGEDFTVIIPKRSLRRVEASGMTVGAMEGRRVRVRGVVWGSRDRPSMEVTVPEAIERLD